MIHRFLLSVTAAILALLQMVGHAGQGSAHLRTLASSRDFGIAYSPQLVQAAYNVTPLYQQGITGAGETVALLEVDTFNPADLNRFDQAYNLPAPQIQTFYAGQKKFSVPVGGEATMDLEWAHAMAPDANLQLYFLNNNLSLKAGWKAMASALREAAANGAGSISISLGTCGPRGSRPTQRALASLEHQGISVFVSSGDSGARPGPVHDCGRSLGVAYPASDPSVVAVGGTSLDLDSSGSILDEVAWRLSGGGHAKFKRPAWQTAPTLPNDGKRWVPDVSFVGDPSTGVSIYYHHRWETAGGTSLGAPSWAGIWALVRQAAAQAGYQPAAAPVALYQAGNSASYDQAFHDVTGGSNGAYQAGSGWDPVTGWGTPDTAGLVATIEQLSAPTQ